MGVTAELADRLTKLLMLAHPPVAVSFRKGTPSADAEAVVKQPAGCCYWALAQKGRLYTKPSDHANCSVGSYTHGLIDLEAAAAADLVITMLPAGPQVRSVYLEENGVLAHARKGALLIDCSTIDVETARAVAAAAGFATFASASNRPRHAPRVPSSEAKAVRSSGGMAKARARSRTSGGGSCGSARLGTMAACASVRSARKAR